MAIGVFAAGMYGITILLDTPQGKIRIESEVDNVQVELVNDQQQVQPVRIETGENAKETKLRAGQYRITLSGPHDGLSIDKDVVVLRRGEKTTARITRIDTRVETGMGRDLRKGMPANQDLPAVKGRERQYQGTLESEWQRRFVSEAEPITKLQAADALISIAAELPDGQNIDRILVIGQEIVQASFGADAILFAFEDPTNPSLRARRWQLDRSDETLRAYQHFQWALNDRIRQFPGLQLADRLSESIVNGPESRAAFAYSLFKYAASNRIRLNPDAVKVALSRLAVQSEGADRSALPLLARFQLINEASETFQQAMLTDMAGLSTQLAERPHSTFHDRLRDGVIAAVRNSCSQQQKFALSPELSTALGNLLLRDIVDDREGALNSFAPNRSLIDAQSLYGQRNIDRVRSELRYVLPVWLPLTNNYFKSRITPPYSTGECNLVKSLNLVLLTASGEGDWPTDKTAEILAEQLRVSYIEPSDLEARERLPASAATLLTELVRISGAIPEFVRSGEPQTLSVNRRLTQLKRLLDGKIEPGVNGMYWQFDELKGLLDDAPYEIIRLAVGEKRLPEQTQIILRGLAVNLEPIELLYVTSDLNDDRNNRRTHPIDPLLLLVTLAELTGVSESQDERIATFLADKRPNRIVLRAHLDVVLSSKSTASKMFDRQLREMTAKAKSQKLITAIESLNPDSVKENPE